MSVDEIVKSVSLPAGADLTTKIYTFGNVNGSGKVITTGAGLRVAGVVYNKPNTDEACTLAVQGVVRVILGGAVTAGDSVKSDADGKAVTAAATNNAAGICITGGVAGNYGTVLLGAHVAI